MAEKSGKDFEYATIKKGKVKVTSDKQLKLLESKKLPFTAVYKSKKTGKLYKERKNTKTKQSGGKSCRSIK